MTPSPFAELSFPLNVYATLLALDLGQADYLHYGLFLSPDEGVGMAQQRSTELLLSRLPAPPARILEVGIGLGTTADKLHWLGYEVHGITPDAVQIALARQRNESLSLNCCRLEDYASQRPFDVMICQESGQYIDPAALFGKADALLVAGGQFILLDECSTEGDKLHPLARLLDTAAQMQFTVLENSDWSPYARHTLQYLLRSGQHWREALLGQLPVSVDMLDGLDRSNRDYQAAYASGRFQYRLLRFTKAA